MNGIMPVVVYIMSRDKNANNCFFKCSSQVLEYSSSWIEVFLNMLVYVALVFKLEFSFF